MSFNSFLKSINQPTMGKLVEPEQDQLTRLSELEKKLNIQRDKGEIITEEQEDGTEI
jgi:hypothetical protein